MLVHQIEKDDSGRITNAKIRFADNEVQVLLTYALNVLVTTGMLLVPDIDENEEGQEASLKDWMEAARDKNKIN